MDDKRGRQVVKLNSQGHREFLRNRKHLQAIPGDTVTQHEQDVPERTTDFEESPSEQLPEANQGTSVPSSESTAAAPHTPQHIVSPKTTRCGHVIRKPSRYQS